MSEQIGQLVFSTNSLILMLLVAVVAVTFVTIAHFVLTEVVGLPAQIGRVVAHYNEALGAWHAFALREGLENSCPVRIEVEAEKAPFGILVKELVVVVRTGFIETRYKLVRANGQFVDFYKVEEESE